MGPGLGLHDVGHDPHEGAGANQEVEEDEHEEDRAGAGGDEPVGDGREAVAVVPDRDDDPAVVARPADERDAENEPDDGGEPSPEVCRDDGAHDGAGGGDGLEVVAEEDVLVRGHEVDAIHVQSGGSRALRVRLDDVAVYPPGVPRVREVHGQHPDDYSQ